MSNLIYVHKVRATTLEDKKREIKRIIASAMVGEEIDGEMIPPFCTGEITIKINLSRIYYFIYTTDNVLHVWYPSKGGILRLIHTNDVPIYETNQMSRKVLKDKTRWSGHISCPQVFTKRTNIIIDDIDIFRTGGWKVNLSPNDFKFEQIVQIHGNPHIGYITSHETNTRWDKAVWVGLAKKIQLNKNKHSLIIRGTLAIKYNETCPHRLEELFFVGWVSHIDTSLENLPKGDGCCLLCADFSKYEQIAIMDYGGLTLDYIKYLNKEICPLDSDDAAAAKYDIIQYGVRRNNIVYGREWRCILSSDMINASEYALLELKNKKVIEYA